MPAPGVRSTLRGSRVWHPPNPLDVGHRFYVERGSRRIGHAHAECSRAANSFTLHPCRPPLRPVHEPFFRHAYGPHHRLKSSAGWVDNDSGGMRPPDLTHYQNRRGHPWPRNHLNRNAIAMLGQPPVSAVTVGLTVGIAGRIASVRAAASYWPSSHRRNSPTPCQNADPFLEQNNLCRHV